VWKHVEGRDREGHLLCERSGTAAAHAEFRSEFADVVISRPAAATDTATQHRIAGDSSTDPRRIHSGADGGDSAHPFVTDPNRIRCLAIAKVLHLTRVELDIGTADACATDVHDGFSRCCHGRLDLENRGLVGSCNGESSHRGASTS
jgi:hypothetical protein